MKFHFVILLLATIFLTGCIVLPVPHVTKKSPRVDGRVVDAESGKPVDGAVVQLTTVGAWDTDKRVMGTSTTTGADGSFHLRTRYNFHLGLYANPSWALHWPPGSYWRGALSVVREGYARLSFGYPERWRDTNAIHVGDLKLVRTEHSGPPPNKSLPPTPGRRGGSAARFTSLGPAWLSSGR